MAPRRAGKKFPGADAAYEGGGEIDTKPTPLFPDYDVPTANPLEKHEKKQVHYYRTLRNKFRDGPYYAILGPTVPSPSSSSSTPNNASATGWASIASRQEEAERRKEKLRAAARASFNPFKGMPKYSNKFHKKQRRLPDLKGREYEVIFFPKELRAKVQPSFKSSNVEDEAPSYKQKRVFEDDDEDRDIDDLDRRAAKRRRRDLDADDSKRVKDEDDEEEEEGENIEEDDEEEDDELVDDDFSEDDDEMGGDYNAEQYFDAGDDDDDGFGDGGGDDDAY